jgi:hypothetical protein
MLNGTSSRNMHSKRKPSTAKHVAHASATAGSMANLTFRVQHPSDG